jgi:proline dehydrogenase
MKLVRGAYMEKNMLAKQKGYPTPICASKEATDANYDATDYMIDHLDGMAIFLGTHNEESTYNLIEHMKSKGVDTKDERIWFGQLYGMVTILVIT